MSDLSINTIRDVVLGHPEAKRLEAIKLLGESGGGGALRILIELIENGDEKENLRQEAVTAVAKIVTRTPHELEGVVKESLENLEYDSSIGEGIHELLKEFDR